MTTSTSLFTSMNFASLQISMFLIIMLIIVSYLNTLIFMIMFIIFSMILTMNMYMNLSTSMYAYIILISIVGSMMVMFLYFVSLINNQKSSFYYNAMFLIPLMLWFIISMKNMNLNFFDFKMNHKFLNQNIYKIYLYPLNLPLAMSMFYLMFTMFLVMKMCAKFNLPMRKLKN